MADDAFMARAVRLAKAGLGATYPNPAVGAVLVRRGKVIAAARSAKTGGPHAEVRALRRAGKLARGATLYVTLEPCSHRGRTGPCTAAIIEAGVARVIVGVLDPAAHAKGKGLRALRRAGIEVERVSSPACAQVHEHYLHHVRTGLPFVTLKAAATLDGRIATEAGDSKWITGVPARREGHRLRARHHAIAVGAETVRLDNPALDVRLVRGVDPTIVVFDGRLRLARTPRKALREGTLVFCTKQASAKARRTIETTGAEVVVAGAGARVDLRAALRELGRREIRSLLVEGGGKLHGGFVAAGAWQRMMLFVAPRLLGDARSMITGISWPTVAKAPRLTVVARRRLGDDLLTILEPAS